MATTSFSESFKYGSRLFGFFLGLLVVGGGMVGGGAYLAVPEIQAWRGSGSAETAFIAGGLILVTLGLSILIIGQYAIIYKLIADGVARGNADPAVDMVVGPDAAEQPEESAETTEEMEAEPDTEQEPTAEREEEEAEQQEAPPEIEPSEPTQPTAEPQESAQPADQPPTPPETEPDHQEQPGREQTAEEIVFGSSERPEEEQTDTEDTGDFEFDDEDKQDKQDEQSRGDVETAGNPSSDPLADNFDDE